MCQGEEMMNKFFYLLFALINIVFTTKMVYAQPDVIKTPILNAVVKVDPYEMNPLSALVSFKTKKPAQISIIIKGRDGSSDLNHFFSEFKKDHKIPVLGLYPNYNNTVIITAFFKDKTIQTEKISIPIDRVNRRALIVVQDKNDSKTKYHFLSDGVVFDEAGYLRFSFSNHGAIAYFMNGEIILERRAGGLVRYSLIGEEKQKYSYPDGFTSFTHGIGQKPNGNFLVIGSFPQTKILVDGEKVPSHREFVIELDYHTGKMLNKIDLAEIMNPNRMVIVPKNHIDYGLNDWCHINGVDYDSSDGGIVVSCRHSGIIKINEKTKELVWIISPNKGFEQSGRLGDGPDISHKVLSAVDDNNKKFNTKIQSGFFSNTSFKWPTKNHNVKVYPNNIIAVYDNAGNVYDKDVYTTDFSNASLYKIDEEKKTVQQFWIENLKFQSSSGSSVLYNPDEKEVVVYSSTIPDKDQRGMSYGLLSRYDFNTHKILFSAVVFRGGEMYYYRNEEFEFYSKDK